ncbi:unnamed protein product [Brassicogethes aeneus]|uniref:Uncharacterized protein n=1 Tax=Brassicogethes aeneus TaxID=1431903 RepID=A0A9P0FMZ7_BRAAE|nr:unnamed protein product [Brassicogethes aeneus]
MAKMRLKFIILLVIFPGVPCTIPGIPPEDLPALAESYLKYSQERMQLQLAAQQAKLHPPQLQAPQDENNQQMEQPQEQEPEVQFFDEEDNFQNFPMMNQETQEISPRGFDAPPTEMQPPQEMPPNQEEGRLFQPEPEPMRREDTDSEQAQQQEFLNNFWANTNNNWNSQAPENFVMDTNGERPTETNQESRAADPTLHHHHHHSHSKGIHGYQSSAVVTPVIVTPAISHGYSGHSVINQGFGGNGAINQGYGGHGAFHQGYSGQSGINQAYEAYGGHSPLVPYSAGVHSQLAPVHSTNVHITNVNSQSSVSPVQHGGYVKSPHEEMDHEPIIGMESPHFTEDIVGMKSPDFNEGIVGEAEPDQSMNIEEPNSNADVNEPVDRKFEEAQLGRGLMLPPGLLHLPLLHAPTLLPTLPLLPHARASVIDPFAHANMQNMQNLQNIKNMQNAAKFYDKMNKDSANFAKNNKQLIENAKKERELFAKNFDEPKKSLFPNTTPKPLFPTTNAQPKPLFPTASDSQPKPLFPFFQKPAEQTKPALNNNVDLSKFGSNIFNTPPTADTTPKSLFDRFAGKNSESKPPALFDLSKFDKSHIKRQADVPETVDGKIPVQVVEGPVKIIHPKEDHVGSPYLFDIPININREAERYSRSNPNYLNMAKEITDHALSSIVNAGKLFQGPKDQKPLENLNIASDITKKALETAQAASNDDEESASPTQGWKNSKVAGTNLDEFKKTMSELQESDTNLSEQKLQVSGDGKAGGLNMAQSIVQGDLNKEKTPKVAGTNLDEFKEIMSELQESDTKLSDEERQILGAINEDYMRNNQNQDGYMMKRQAGKKSKNDTKESKNTKDTEDFKECDKDCSDDVLESILGAQQQTKDQESLDEAKISTDKQLKKIIKNQKDFHKGKMSQESIDDLLNKQKDVIKELKRSQVDDDLIMIGNIGDGVMKDMDESKKITKRSIRTSSSKNLLPIHKHHMIKREEPTPFQDLITDPKTKIDMPKTLDHIGSVARHLFEDETAPIFHFRNLVGSAQNSAMSAMKIPPKQLFIPTTYSIVQDKDLEGKNQPVVGAVNPQMFSRMGGVESEPLAQQTDSKDFGKMFSGFTSTFDRVGSAIKQSIANGRQTLIHVNEAANNAKSAIQTMHNLKPKLVKTEHVDNKSKSTMISPRILDINIDDEQVGASQPSTDPQSTDLLKFGDVFDAVGFSKPDEKLEMERIVFTSNEPPVVYRNKSKVKASPTALRSILKMQHKDLNKMEKTVSNLDQAERTVGATNLEDFMGQMKEHMDDMHEIADKHEQDLLQKKQERIKGTKSRASFEEHQKRLRMGKGKKYDHLLQKKHQKSKNKPMNTNYYRSSEDVAATLPKKNDNKEIPSEDLRVGLELPPELLHPYMGLPELTQYVNQAEQTKLKFNEDQGDNLQTEHKEFKQKPIKSYYRSAENDVDEEHRQHSSSKLVLGNPAIQKYLNNDKLTSEQKSILQATNAINFEKMFKEAKNQEEKSIVKRQLPEPEPSQRTSMVMSKIMKKPFMGRPSDEKYHEYYSEYNNMENPQPYTAYEQNVQYV